MAMYSANKPNRTLVIHKSGCHHIPSLAGRSCGCGERGKGGNQEWYCEDHVSILEVSDMMHGRFWGVLLCGDCY